LPEAEKEEVESEGGCSLEEVNVGISREGPIDYTAKRALAGARVSLHRLYLVERLSIG
jgi:hypothetical protein